LKETENNTWKDDEDIQKEIKNKLKRQTITERERNKNKEIRKEAVKGFTCHLTLYV
jgi:hypothetical protein